MSSEDTNVAPAQDTTTEQPESKGLLASVTGFLSTVVEKVEGAAIAAKDAVLGDSTAEEKKEEVKEAATEKKDEIVEKATEKKEELKDKAEDLKKDATKKKDELVEKASDKKEELTEKKDEIKSDAADKKETLLEKATEIKDSLLEKAVEVKDAMVGKINEIKETVAEGVANAQAAATEAKDSVKEAAKEAPKETEAKDGESNDADSDEGLDEAEKIAKKLGHGPATKVGGMRVSQNQSGPHLFKKADGTTHHHSGTAHFEVKHETTEKSATELALAEKAAALQTKEVSHAPKDSKANPSTYHHQPSKHDEHAKTPAIQPNFQPASHGNNH